MKKAFLLMAVLTLVAFASAMAQQKPAPAPTAAPTEEKPKEAKAAKLERFSGTVEKVDEMAKIFVVKGKKESKEFTLGDKTKLTRAGKEVPLAELKTGMAVIVQYEKVGDKAIASSVKVAAPKTKPKTQEKPAETPAPKPAEAPKK